MRNFKTFALGAVVAVALSAGPAAAQVRLLFTSMGPPDATGSIFFKDWAKRVSDAARGSGEVEVRDGAALANFTNVYERVLNDVVQIGFGQQAFIAGKFPLTEVTNLPFVVKDNTVGSVALWRLYKSGLLDKEYDEVVPVWLSLLGPAYIHMVREPRTLDTLEGLKVRVAGRVVGRALQALGGTPISLPAESLYEALQRGTLDGAITSWSAFEPFRLGEVTFHHILAPLGAAPAMFFMAKKKWDALPAPLRAALETNGGEAQARTAGEVWKRQGLQWQISVAQTARHRVVEPAPAQMANWQARVEPVIAEWTAGASGGAQVLERYRSLYVDAERGR
jgi:TRAP-type C4-dicarboxylate transport system substrate-binding protein